MDKTVRYSNSIRNTVISIIANAALSAVKLAAGAYGHSRALIADAIHSLSDVLATLIVMLALIISGKAPDRNHEYGHQRYESVASLFLSIILGYVGISIGISGAEAIISGSYMSAPSPTVLTACAAALSIIVKEIMFRRSMYVAKKEKSNALKADAWHHRSDALSSVGSLAGIILAKLGFPIMDSVAGIAICLFIMKMAVSILIDAVKSLTDCAAPSALETGVREVAASVDGVIRVDELKTRIFGSGFYADIEIVVDGAKTLEEAHGIAERVHDAVESGFHDIWHCMVHVNPSDK